MNETVGLSRGSWSAAAPGAGGEARHVAANRLSAALFAATLAATACLAAALAGLAPLQVSIVTVFLFAGPHNWFEARYFLQRLPLRLGRSRAFFVVAICGVLLLTFAYISLTALTYSRILAVESWPLAISVWNTSLLLWIASLAWMRGRQRKSRDWSWVWPAAFALGAANWLAPQLFSLAIVYVHPLIALFFLDRHLRRTRPEWLATYRRCLCLLPVMIAGICWQLARLPSLPDDNGLAWRITQHAGGDILPWISTHMLVSVHVFLEMLHYSVWIVALPLIGATGAVWDFKSIPLFRHRQGFPRLIATFLLVGVLLVVGLWAGFSVNYAATRDIYFALAIAHVLAEAPFLLRTL